jgi:hypothetical protein
MTSKPQNTRETRYREYSVKTQEDTIYTDTIMTAAARAQFGEAKVGVVAIVAEPVVWLFPGNGASAWLRAQVYNTMTNTEGTNHSFFEPSNFLPMSQPGRLEVRNEVGWSMEKSGCTAQLNPQDALKLGEDLGIGDGLAGLIIL